MSGNDPGEALAGIANFYKRVFDAEELFRLASLNDRVGRAELNRMFGA
jgi:hypothetical protein